MKNYRKVLGVLAAASSLMIGNASAQVAYTLHAGYSSEYLWRGLDLGSDLVETGLDVSGKLYGLDLSAGAWYGSFSYAGANQQELDLYGEVAKDFGFLKGSVGVIAYQYPNSNFDSIDEIYFGIARNIGFADASLKYFWGVEGPGYGYTDGYTEFALSRSFELSPCLALGVSTNVGYLVEDDAFTAWTSKVSLDWGFAEHAKLSPYVALSIALGDAKNTSWAVTNNELVGGCMLSVTF
jgi:hypothetical protein